LTHEASELISTRHLEFRYRDAARPAVHDIDLDVDDGAIVAVLGANGSGKSTLARLIGGLIKPTKGTVTVDGVDTTAQMPGWAMHQHVGMVFQNPQNQIVSTVVENEVAFGLENLRMGSAAMQARVHECLELVGMAHLRTANPHELSAGEQQRLGVASALAANPRHLILDEATALLDDQTRIELMSRVHALALHLRLSVIVITHRMDEVEIAGRVIVLSQGSIVFDDTPVSLFMQAEKLSGWNLALPPLQALTHAIRDAGLDVPVGARTPAELAGALWP
jgi:energy-coupling factor transport system ATP-binding protein